MQSEELEFLLSLLQERAFSGNFLEIGTAAGGTLCRMLQALEKLGRRGSFVVVDPMTYFPDQLAKVRENLARHGLDPAHVDFRVMSSRDACAQACRAGEAFDFILVDGSHKLSYVTQDLNWARCLNPGGLLLFHDYTPEHPGVVIAVNRFLRRHPQYEKLGLAKTLLAVEKTGPDTQPIVGVADRLLAGILGPYFQLKKSAAKRLKRLRAAFARGGSTHG